jgi:hypothetical protein
LWNVANYRNGFEVTLQPQMLELPLHRKTRSAYSSIRCEICFTTKCRIPYIMQVFDLMVRAQWRQYQVSGIPSTAATHPRTYGEESHLYHPALAAIYNSWAQ